jgi:molecular chaperone GrpE
MNQDERNEIDDAAEEMKASSRAPNAEDAEHEDGARPDQRPGTEDEAGGDSDESGGSGNNEEVARMREAMLRLKAEMDNREKRLEREMTKSRKFALEAVMRDLVQVLDSMDQALSSADAENAQAAHEGLELTRKQALQVLTSHGLEVLDPVGEQFDPSWHEAMATQPSDEFEPDTVAQVLQKGYRLNDRLIRPARVIVAK